MVLRSTRDGYGEALLELGREDDKIVVLCADLTESTRTHWFKQAFPDRFFELGVAEQDMMSVASGFSLMGYTAFASTFGVFASGRAWDQIRLSIAFMNLNVKIGATHGGLTVGEDGASHQALEELALMRVLPNMHIIVPADALEAKKATIAAARHPGPFFLRLGRNKVPVVTREDTEFEIGRGIVLQEGEDVSIFACGVMFGVALETIDTLEKKGIRAELINMHTIKPLDRQLVIHSAQKTKAVVSIEEHSIYGGLGEAIAACLIENYPVPMEIIGVNDEFGESGSPEELLDRFGLNQKGIVKAVERVLDRKNERSF